jgi:hypothetical protein
MRFSDICSQIYVSYHYDFLFEKNHQVTMLRYHRVLVTMKMMGFHQGFVLNFEQYAVVAPGEKGEAVEALCDRGNVAAAHCDMSSQVVRHGSLHVAHALEVHNWLRVSLDRYGSDLQTTVKLLATATFASGYSNPDQRIPVEHH